MNRLIASVAIALVATVGASPAVAAAQIEEDEHGFSYVTYGSEICGPVNADGTQAGQLIAWPYEIVPAWCSDICLGA
ncbi:MAG: hypothetical protein WBB07_15840 [Mycobacterium sp.]